jgi:hypothetical protein
LASRPSNNRGILPISSIAEIAGVAQLGVVVDPAIVFPPEFPYTTGNTKALRDNFVELYRECSAMVGLAAHDLIVDIGSNDSTLLANFKAPGHRVVGIEPTDVARAGRRLHLRVALSDVSARWLAVRHHLP